MAKAGEINYSMSGDPKDVVRAFTALGKKIDQVERKLKQTGQTGRKSTKDTSDGMAGAGRSALKFAGRLAGVGSAAAGVYAIAAQLRREYEHLKRQQAEAGLAQLTVGDLRGYALINRPTDVDGKLLDRLVEQTASKEEISQKRLWPLISSRLSAKGPLSDAAFEDAFRRTARIGAIGGPGVDLAVRGGAAMDIMKVTGGNRADVALGFMMSVGTAARVDDPAKQAAAIPRVLSAAKPAYWTLEQASELWTYLTGASADREGRRSATGAINFMQLLFKGRTAEGAMIPYEEFGKIKRRPLRAKGMAGLTELQDWYAQAPENLRELLLAGLQAEAAVKGSLQSLVARDPQAMKIWERAREATPSPTAPGLAGAYEDYFKGVAVGKHEPVRAANRALDAFQEGERLRDEQGGMAGMLRVELDESLAAIKGIRDIDRKLLRAKWELGSGFGRGDPMGAAIEQLRELQRTKGYGAKFRRAPWSNWGPAFVEDLPAEGAERVGKTWIRPEHWQVPVEHYGREVKSSYMRRTEGYDPKQAASIDRLIVALEKLAASQTDALEKLAASQAADKPQPVKIVADERPTAPPPVEDHTE